MLLFADQTEMISTTDTASFVVVVHGQLVEPFADSFGVFASASKETTIGIQMVMLIL